MLYVLEKKFANDKLNIELTSYIDNKQNVWFKGKDVALILGYSNTDQALRKQVESEDKKRTSGFSRRFDGLFPKRSTTYFYKWVWYLLPCIILKIRTSQKVQALRNFY